MWLSIGVVTSLCLLTSQVLAQQELIFASARNYSGNTAQELVFAPSNNPASVRTGQQAEQVYNNFGQSGAPRFASSSSNNHNNGPALSSSSFRSSDADTRQSGSPAFLTTSAPYPTTRSPYDDYNRQPVFVTNPVAYPTTRSPYDDYNNQQSPRVDGRQSGPPVFVATTTRSPYDDYNRQQSPGRSSAADVSQSRPAVFPSGSTSHTEASDYVDENLRKLSKGAEKFALEYLARISNEHLSAPHRSYMVSPLSVWSLLALLTEGAQDKSLYELRNTLKLDDYSPQSLRSAYRQITKRLNTVTNFVEVSSYQALFTDINKPVNREYEDTIEREYESVLTPVNFADINTTFVQINRDIDVATRGLLPHSVLPQDLIDVQLLMISSLYFKGKWRYPFETANTHLVPFHDEQGTITGNVEMMMQIGHFNYVQMKEMDSHVIELPYGTSNRMSMLIILPKKGTTLNHVMNSLRNVGVSAILQKLYEDEQTALRDGVPMDVEVFLPKFTTQTHFSIRPILENMGLIDIFQPAYANLTKIAKDVYVSSIFQSTRIIVNEDGTEAAAVAIASLINKASPVRFYFDRPFAYLIVEKTANLLLFAGEVKSHM